MSKQLKVWEVLSWTPPTRGLIKVNRDATFDKISGSVAAVAIIRGSFDSFLGGISSSFLAPSASSVEVHAVRLRTVLASKKRYVNVITESNN
ncbi:hypothetical protein V6N11_043156 [Hibiscus sabdariffa]|uniref:RNase H type-1 domain-containing protein n=1 Tax=Hibiscus sabdariffa TaxID=183260 RepID=A0ABR2QYK0_9ROSI